ncbi:MAG: hypothetical protein D6720_03025, partial [Gammaproteobacteria bacterium]
TMPSGMGANMGTYRSHVRELLARHRKGQSLADATEAEVYLFLALSPHPLSQAATRLFGELEARVREGDNTPVTDALLFDALRQGCHKRPAERRLRRLVKEDKRWQTEPSSGQAA